MTEIVFVARLYVSKMIAANNTDPIKGLMAHIFKKIYNRVDILFLVNIHFSTLSSMNTFSH